MALSGGPKPSEIITEKSVRERAARTARSRRLDQRHHPSDRRCRPPRHRHRPEAAEPALRRDAGAGGSEADRPALPAGSARRGRIERAALGVARLLHLDCRTVEGGHAGRTLDGAARLRRPRRGAAARGAGRSGRRAGGVVRQSGARRSDSETLGCGCRRCSSARGVRWYSSRCRTWPSGSTIPALDVTAEDFLVLKNAGPRSPSGMPEAGYLPIPKKLAQAGVKDMVRISDARMSGTAYGTVVLHVTPDAASGGPARAGTQRRPHRSERQGQADRSAGPARRSGAAPRGLERPATSCSWLCAALRREHSAGRSRLRLRVPARRITSAKA